MLLSPRVAHLLVRYRGRVALVWLGIGAVLFPPAARLAERLSVAASVTGSESAQVEDALVRRFASPFARYAVLTVEGLPSPTTLEGRARLTEITATTAAAPGVSRVFSFLDVRDTLFLGRDGGTFVFVGLAPQGGDADALFPALRAGTDSLRERLRSRHPGVQLSWTGDLALNHDLRETSATDVREAEARVLPLTLVLLVIAFGAIVAALLPVLAGAAAIALALGAASLLALHWPLSVLLQNVVSMLGLGLGIDYALLVVSRFRSELATGASPEQAAERTATHAGGTIAISAATVAVGFAPLLFVPATELRSIAIGGMLVVAFAALLACTLLPGALATLGHRLELGRVRPRRRADARASRWLAWSGWVTGHPVLTIALAGIPLVLLASQATRLGSDMPRGDWLPPTMESARGLHALERMGRGGVVHTLRIVVDLPANARVTDDAGWRAIRELGDRIGSDPRIARIRSLPAVVRGDRPNLMLLSMVPLDVRRSLASDDGRVALIEAVPAEGVEHRDLMRLVRELRVQSHPELAGIPDAVVQIGGMPAVSVDYQHTIARSAPMLVGLVVAGTFVALLLAFRSVLVPLKAIALNLLSVAAAFGAVALVFHDPVATRWLGMAEPLDGMFPLVPPIVFCVVFGLSMDYEVFIVARIAEARRAGFDDRAAIGEGLAHTGGVITGAAAIMLVIFAAFMVGDFVLMKILGFALAVAVAIDATLVRMALGPALLSLAGRWNWWPGDAQRARVPISSREAPAGEPDR